MKSKA
jgi:hypothetical protein